MQELPENTVVSEVEIEGKKLWKVQLDKTKTYGETKEQAIDNFLILKLKNNDVQER